MVELATVHYSQMASPKTRLDCDSCSTFEEKGGRVDGLK